MTTGRINQVTSLVGAKRDRVVGSAAPHNGADRPAGAGLLPPGVKYRVDKVKMEEAVNAPRGKRTDSTLWLNRHISLHPTITQGNSISPDCSRNWTRGLQKVNA